jgi:hypothetical protein
MTLDEIRALGREELAALAAERVREDQPDFDASIYTMVTVEDSGNSLDVTLETPFEFYPPKEKQRGHYFQVMVFFREDGAGLWKRGELFVPGEDFHEFLKLAGAAGLQLDHCVDARVQPGGFEVTMDRGDGRDCYFLDAATGEAKLLWQDTEDPAPDAEIME